jgi:hypothetical protein
VSIAGLIPKISYSNNTDALSSIAPPVPPEKYLARRGLPRELLDIYWTKLPGEDSLPALQLPDSDLLKAIHAYASEFYSRAALGERRDDLYSMDETALIAMGILLEEAGKHALGNAGDMVFVEGAEDGVSRERSSSVSVAGRSHRGRSRSRSVSVAAIKSGETRRGKRRKIDTLDGDLPHT